MFSSEDKAAKTYLWVLAMILLIAFGTIILLSWVVDPLGTLRTDRGFHKLCADGIKTTDDRASIPLLPLKSDFSQAVIGTSRIKRGFTREVFGNNNHTKIVNLGISSLTMEELYQLTEPFLLSGQLDTLWVGLDFGMFGKRNPADMSVYKRSRPSHDRLRSYLSGAASFTAWRELTFVLKRFKSCRTPVRDYQGFIIEGGYWNKRNSAWNNKTASSDTVQLTKRRLLKEFSKTDSEQHARYRYHFTLLEQLLQKAADNSVQLYLFINPSHPGYFEVLAQAGKLDDYHQWKFDLEALIQNATYTLMQPIFQDFSDLHSHIDIMPSGCDDSFAPPCPFYDFTHYRPQLAVQILRELQKGHD